MKTTINKNCLDEISFNEFTQLLNLNYQSQIKPIIEDTLKHQYVMLRDENESMELNNSGWRKTITTSNDLNSNFDLVYAYYFFSDDPKGITYDFQVFLKNKSMPFVVQLLFDTEPENFSDKQDIYVFPNIKSVLSFYKDSYSSKIINQSFNEYNLLKLHSKIDKNLENKNVNPKKLKI